jgi:integrase
LSRAGINGGNIREKKGKVGRSVSALSFHSFRHCFNSALATGNVDQELRQALTGHRTPEMNLRYTHRQMQSLRNAVSSIAPLPKEGGSDGKSN